MRSLSGLFVRIGVGLCLGVTIQGGTIGLSYAGRRLHYDNVENGAELVELRVRNSSMDQSAAVWAKAAKVARGVGHGDVVGPPLGRRLRSPATHAVELSRCAGLFAAFGLGFQKSAKFGACDKRRSARVDGAKPGLYPGSDRVLMHRQQPRSFVHRVRAVDLDQSRVGTTAHILPTAAARPCLFPLIA